MIFNTVGFLYPKNLLVLVSCMRAAIQQLCLFARFGRGKIPHRVCKLLFERLIQDRSEGKFTDTLIN